MTDLAAQKAIARKLAGVVRATAHADLSEGAGVALVIAAGPFFDQLTPGSVSGFFPFRSEIDTRSLLSAFAARGWDTALPVVVAPETPLSFRAWKPGEAMIAGKWNIPVPEKTAAETVPNVMLVPMLSYDRQGYRLGYGGGFYDLTIATLRKAGKVAVVGVAYSAQEVDTVPRGVHDERLDWVLTESGLRRVS
jgi:5-formyltetrahydrofolate cyclo-ligase